MCFWFQDCNHSVSVNCIKIILFSIIVFCLASLSLISHWTNITLSIFPGKYCNYSITAILILEHGVLLAGIQSCLLTQNRVLFNVLPSKKFLKGNLKFLSLFDAKELCLKNKLRATPDFHMHVRFTCMWAVRFKLRKALPEAYRARCKRRHIRGCTAPLIMHLQCINKMSFCETSKSMKRGPRVKHHTNMVSIQAVISASHFWSCFIFPSCLTEVFS